MSDKWIAKKGENMIAPFLNSLISTKSTLSYGLSSYGYDVRIDRKFKVFTNRQDKIVDPKNFDTDCAEDFIGDKLILPPNSFALGCTVETIRVPDDVLVLCIGKSTYARCGLIINTTPLEPGWEGKITIEISNTTQMNCVIYANEGIAQLLFFRGNEQCEISYQMRSGKYMHQSTVTLPSA